MSLDSRLERILAGKPRHVVDSVTASRLLLLSATLLEQRVNEALTPFSLHMKEYLALNLLADAIHEPVRPTALSVSLDATRTQVTRLLDGLERRGLLERSADAEDRRSLQLRLTDEGAALLQRALPVVQETYLRIWGALDEDGAQAVQQHLRTVLQQLKHLNGDTSTD